MISLNKKIALKENINQCQLQAFHEVTSYHYFVKGQNV